MGTPITSYELQRRLDIAKKREAARAAARLAATPKPYAPEDIGATGYFRSVEDENLYVEMPVPAKAGATFTADSGAALGGLTTAEVGALAGAAYVPFKGNNKQILRIRFTRRKATPTTKMTSWGTRVVDHVDDSVTVPFGAPANSNLGIAKTAFAALVASTGGAGLLGTRKGNKAELIYNGRVISKVVV